MNTVAPTAVRLLEELALNAWPSLNSCYYDGWLLRFANGYTRRANSVNPLNESSLALGEKIRFCETLYLQHGQSAIFKLTSAALSGDLDRALAERGYTEAAPSKVLLLDDLSLSPAPEYHDATLLNEATPAWIDNFVALSGTDVTHGSAMQHIFASILFPKAFAMLCENGTPVAMGMAVVERGYVCFHDIIVAKDKRGQGIGTQLMSHLTAWARANGALHGYLQVLRDNEPANKLYTRLGFVEAYHYWYRVKQTTLDMHGAF